MSGQHPPLALREVEAILANLCFVPRPPKTGTSHRDWVKLPPHPFSKVTVDPNESPFSGNILNWMIKQSRSTRKEFYAARFEKTCTLVHASR